MTPMETRLPALLPSLRALSRVDKLHLIQFLAQELAQEEASLLEAGASYPIYTPHQAFGAAAALLQANEPSHVNSQAAC
jgi:hypothetical protein